MPTRPNNITDDEWSAIKRSYRANPDRDNTTRMKPKNGISLEVWQTLTYAEREAERQKERNALKAVKAKRVQAFNPPVPKTNYLDSISVTSLVPNWATPTKEEYDRLREAEVDYREPRRGAGVTFQDSSEGERSAAARKAGGSNRGGYG